MLHFFRPSGLVGQHPYVDSWPFLRPFHCGTGVPVLIARFRSNRLAGVPSWTYLSHSRPQPPEICSVVLALVIDRCNLVDAVR